MQRIYIMATLVVTTVILAFLTTLISRAYTLTLAFLIRRK